ncbi:O-methyltransferase [Spirochaetota bacterium]
MEYIKSILKKILRPLLRQRAKNRVIKINKNLNDELSKNIISAIEDTLINNIHDEEKIFIDKIESLRQSLNSSSQKLTVTDYGAGSPNVKQRQDEMPKDTTYQCSVSDVSGASKSFFWGLLLFKILRYQKPAKCIELGTCLGISGSYQASALKINGTGDLITLEGVSSFASLSEKHFQQLGLDNVQTVTGPFQETLKNVLIENQPVDYVFIDGHHDEEATINYYYEIFPFLNESSILVFDDISWSKGMKRAWKKITGEKDIKVVFDLWPIGICILNKNISTKTYYSIPII